MSALKADSVSLDQIIDHHLERVRFWLVLGPTLVGFYPITGLINPFWGSLSGWPLYWASRGHPVYGPHPWYEPVAFFGGPLVALMLRIWLSDLLLRWKNPLRGTIVLLWALSAFAAAPAETVFELFQGWPIWCACE